MMRGINHQNRRKSERRAKLAWAFLSEKEEDEVSIFEEPKDYYQFINILDRMRTQYDDEGNPCGTNCIYYAYCLMSNHFHLLIRERDEKVGDTIIQERACPLGSAALATNGTQERFGLFHDPSALYSPESCQGRYCYSDQGLWV